MDDAQAQSVIAMIRTIAPQFEKDSDATVQVYMELAEPFVSENKLGPFYVRALAEYAAHLMTLRDMIAADGASGASLVSVGVTSEREGDLQRTYGTSTETDGSDLTKTIYGKRYKKLLRMCIVPIKTRMG